ncbi:hypothetical protein D3C81_2014890 [compost metagenome]
MLLALSLQKHVPSVHDGFFQALWRIQNIDGALERLLSQVVLAPPHHKMQSDPEQCQGLEGW